MLVYCGIDEAGYGPLLGPLCVAAVTLHLPDADPADGAPSLWDDLSDVVCRERRDARGRIAIDDSKRLKGARDGKQHPLRHLERGVLCGLLALHPGAPPTDDAAFFAAVGAEVPTDPWATAARPLPKAGDVGTLRIDAARFRRGLEAAGVRLAGMRVDAVHPRRLNDGMARAGSKAAVNLEAVFRHLAAVRAAHPGETPRIVVDRQGGRVRYRDELARAFPSARVDVVVEHPDLSRYHLEDDAGAAMISFAKGAEERHLPVALASMAAKYTRELFMERLNGWFGDRAPDVAATAGYVTDGRRWLEEVAPVIETERIDRLALVRQG